MIFPDNRLYICKYCGKKLEAFAGSNSARLINHLYEDHQKQLHADNLMNVYLNDLINIAFELKGAEK